MWLWLLFVLKFCADMIAKTLTFHVKSNLSHLEHIEHCYKVIIVKEKWGWDVRCMVDHSGPRPKANG